MICNALAFLAPLLTAWVAPQGDPATDGAGAAPTPPPTVGWTSPAYAARASSLALPPAGGRGSALGGGAGGLGAMGGAGGLGGMNGLYGGRGGISGSAGNFGLGSLMGGQRGGAPATGRGARGAVGFRSPTRLVPGGTAAALAAARGLDPADGGATNPFTKFDLLGAKPQLTGLPSILLGSLSGGPLSEEDARALVEALVAIGAPGTSAGSGPSLSETSHRMFAETADPDLTALQAKLETLVPPADPAAPQPIDVDALKAWFSAIDLSEDHAISFLEWRDRTRFGLDLFRRIDTSGEGLIQFDEFARTLLLNAPKSGREVDPALRDWATGASTPAPADAAADATEPPSPAAATSFDDVLQHARSMLATAALEQSAKNDAAAAAAAAAKGKPAAPPAKPGATANGMAAPTNVFDLLGKAAKSGSRKKAPKPQPLPPPVPPTELPAGGN